MLEQLLSRENLLEALKLVEARQVPLRTWTSGFEEGYACAFGNNGRSLKPK
ncbi:hypothetical protein [Cohnella yongneupensis]|uniref:Uncharacterized protein n=1 Tax=Cohnella yongneupensis TaxID=425006 RepID=A0ABW0QUY0_9BACL